MWQLSVCRNHPWKLKIYFKWFGLGLWALSYTAPLFSKLITHLSRVIVPSRNSCTSRTDHVTAPRTFFSADWIPFDGFPLFEAFRTYELANIYLKLGKAEENKCFDFVNWKVFNLTLLRLLLDAADTDGLVTFWFTSIGSPPPDFGFTCLAKSLLKGNDKY